MNRRVECLPGGPACRARLRTALVPFALVLALVSVATPRIARAERSMVLATTTSVRDSGLLDAILPAFRERTGIAVRVIAVGTGAALRMGREGNADLLLTHAPAAEEALVDEGIASRRTPFMQNFFVIAGPPDDPARVAQAESAEAAIRRIAQHGAPWVSRADDSGTHKREQALFEAAGLDPEQDLPAIVRTGSGMGLSLQVAGERRSYILSDLGTFLAFAERTGLVALSQPTAALRNTYSLLQLDATRFERPIRGEEAEALERYLLEPETQDRIGRHGRDRFGRALFTPLRPKPATRRAQAESN